MVRLGSLVVGAVDELRGEAAVAVHGRDDPGIAVADVVTFSDPKPSVVVSGDDPVSDTGCRTVTQLDTVLARPSSGDCVGAAASIQLGDGGVVSCDQ